MAFSSSSSDTNFGDRSSRGSKFGGRPHPPAGGTSRPATGAFQFDILTWYPKHQSCQKYFVDHAQHDVLVQAFASFINILLPHQRHPPIYSTTGAISPTERRNARPSPQSPAPNDTSSCAVSLLPYIRRLVATGMDVPQILHGFFGDDWAAGIGPQREQERRNFLFTAKSVGWASVKSHYDMSPLETVPFLRPLHEPTEKEIEAAENSWTEWSTLQDWTGTSRVPE